MPKQMLQTRVSGCVVHSSSAELANESEPGLSGSASSPFPFQLDHLSRKEAWSCPSLPLSHHSTLVNGPMVQHRERLASGWCGQ